MSAVFIAALAVVALQLPPPATDPSFGNTSRARLIDDGAGVLPRRELVGQSESVSTAREIVRVSATEPWTDTGLYVRGGDLVTVHAEGTVQLSSNPGDLADPNGSRSGRRAPNAPILNAPAGALVMRIGESVPMLLGANGTISRAPVAGRLYLAVNDDHLPDNRGEYRVRVDIERR